MQAFTRIRKKAFGVIELIFFDRHRSLIICIAFAAISLVVELFLNVSTLFSCSGAFISVAGIFLNIKHSLNFHLKIPKEQLLAKLAGESPMGGFELTPENEKWVDNIISDEIYGVSFMVVGTVVWAYGSFFVKAINCI